LTYAKSSGVSADEMSRGDSPESRFQVCLFGARLDNGNRGVTALAAALIKLVLEVQPGAEIKLLIGARHSKPQRVQFPERTLDVPVVNYRWSFRAHRHEHVLWILFGCILYRLLPLRSVRAAIRRSTPWIDALCRSDFVGDIRAGDSFSDIYGLGRMISGCVPIFTALILGRPPVLLPQTYGPYDSALSRWVAGFVFQRAARVLSRDKEGLTLVSRMMSRDRRDRLGFCPDVAFVLDAIRPDNLHVEPALDSAPGTCLVGLNVNGLVYKGGYSQRNMFGLACDYRALVVDLARRLLDDTDAHILLVPHTFAPRGDINSDSEGCEDLFATLASDYPGRVHIVRFAFQQHEIKGVIGLCDFFIGTRMHACIAALSSGIPVVGLAYSRKFATVFESVDAAELVVDLRTGREEEVVSRVLDLFHKRAEVRGLQPRIRGVQEEVRRTFRSLLETSSVPRS
jgi:colanic acid/amylovoran biosynthesis protein